MKTQKEIEQLANDDYAEDSSSFLDYIEGYEQCLEDMVNEINKQISDFQHDLRECTSTYVKENCEGAIFGLNRLLQSLNKQD